MRGFGFRFDHWADEGVVVGVGVDRDTLPAYEGNGQRAEHCTGIPTPILPPPQSPPSYEEATQPTPYGLVDGVSSPPCVSSSLSSTLKSFCFALLSFTSGIIGRILAIPLPSSRQLRGILFDSTTFVAFVLGLLLYFLLTSEV